MIHVIITAGGQQSTQSFGPWLFLDISQLPNTVIVTGAHVLTVMHLTLTRPKRCDVYDIGRPPATGCCYIINMTLIAYYLPPASPSFWSPTNCVRLLGEPYDDKCLGSSSQVVGLFLYSKTSPTLRIWPYSLSPDRRSGCPSSTETVLRSHSHCIVSTGG